MNSASAKRDLPSKYDIAKLFPVGEKTNINSPYEIINAITKEINS